MSYKDADRQREYQRKWARDNRDKQRDRRNKSRKWLAEYKETLACERCGENHPACLDFHHLSDKKYGIAKMAADGMAIATIETEIAKCIILCANCHRKEHGALV